jgi:uncharacterized sulfatase
VQAAGELKGPERLFFRQTKPLEEFYDTEEDPHELRNLAEEPAQQARLGRMRQVMDEWLRDTRDLGFVPEMELDVWLEDGGNSLPPGDFSAYELTTDDASEREVFGTPLVELINELNGDDRLGRLRAMATIGLAGSVATPLLTKGLGDPDSAVAYWAARRLGDRGQPDVDVVNALSSAIKRPEVSARLAAAGALCKLGEQDEALDVVLEGLKHEDPFVRLFAVQALEAMPSKDDRTLAALTEATEDKVWYIVRVAEHALTQE